MTKSCLSLPLNTFYSLLTCKPAYGWHMLGWQPLAGTGALRAPQRPFGSIIRILWRNHTPSIIYGCYKNEHPIHNLLNLINISQLTASLPRIMYLKSAKSWQKLYLRQISLCLKHTFYSSPESFTQLLVVMVVTFKMSAPVFKALSIN